MSIQTISTRFEQELLKSIEVEKERIAGNMLAAPLVADYVTGYVTYRENVAYVRALNCLISFCEDIRAELAKET